MNALPPLPSQAKQRSCRQFPLRAMDTGVYLYGIWVEGSPPRSSQSLQTTSSNSAIQNLINLKHRESFLFVEAVFFTCLVGHGVAALENEVEVCTRLL